MYFVSCILKFNSFFQFYLVSKFSLLQSRRGSQGRKENQIYTADEQRALAMMKIEEHAKREEKIKGNLRQMIQEQMKEAELEQEKEEND